MTDLLSEYHAIANKLPIESRHHFNDFFIGALSNHVKDKGWRSSLHTAIGCVEALNHALDGSILTHAAGGSRDLGGSDSPASPSGDDGSEDRQCKGQAWSVDRPDATADQGSLDEGLKARSSGNEGSTLRGMEEVKKGECSGFSV